MRVRLAAILAVLVLAAGLAVSTAQPAAAGNSLKVSRGNSLGNSLVATGGVKLANGLANGLRANGLRANGLLVMPLASGVPNTARIRHRSDSAVSSIRACKDAASSSACASGSRWETLSRNETTPAGDWDGYTCPAGHACRTYYGAVYTDHPRRSSSFFVKVSGCFGCTKSVRVM